MPVRDALIKSGFEGDGLQAVRKCNEIAAALAAEGLRCDLIRTSLAIGVGAKSTSIEMPYAGHKQRLVTGAPLLSDGVPLELYNFSEVPHGKLRIVTAGVDVKLVGDAAGIEQQM